MNSLILHRRSFLAGTAIVPLTTLATPMSAQPALPPIRQPAEVSRAAFLARAHELRDEAVAAGDQPSGAILFAIGLIVGEGRSQVVTLTDPTAHSELMAVRDAARRLGTRDLSDCEMYSS